MSPGPALAACVGDFAFVNEADVAVLRQALAQAPACLVLIGSAFQARSARLPFSWEERADLIRNALGEAASARLYIEPLRERYDAQRTAQEIQHAVSRHSQDGTAVMVAAAGGTADIESSLFSAPDAQAALAAVSAQVPAGTREWLASWVGSAEYQRLREEWQQIALEKKAWSVAPYPVVLVTVDVVVRTAGHVLLIRRGRQPGKGLRALPGGFLEPSESVYESAVRELVEETRFGLDAAQMRSALRGVQVFDHPRRSQRGRVITHAHYFDLGERPLSRVEGADDAAAAEWVPLAQLPAMEDQFLDDHFHILDRFLHLSQKNTL
jgi:bifunctional NMN adenylyltransferase/nudix hydrolase